MATPIPQNTATFSLAELAEVTAAAVPKGLTPNVLFRGVTTDSRGALGGKLFVALRGERFDGHDHVLRALSAGALGALVDRRSGSALPELVVPDTLTALGEVAARFRDRIHFPLVGIAGAAGKTTTRAVTETLLRAELGDAVLATPGNLNNRVGLPMVLLSAQPDQRAGVLELGTNQPGEVGALTGVLRPEVALLTLIALEHSEGLGDLDGVEREEADIFARGPRVAIGNADDARVERVLSAARAEQRVRYGFAPDSDYAVTGLETRRGRSNLELCTPHGRFSLSLPWLPHTAALAIAAGMAAAESVLGRRLSPALVEEALNGPAWRQPGRFRLQALADGTLLVDDSYNSNPASLRAALSSTRELAAGRSSVFHLVLGEMRELGHLSEPEHRSIGRELASLGAASITAIGGDARYFVAPEQPPGTRPDGFFDDWSSAEAHVLGQVRAGEVVLVKGSRGVRCDELVAAIERVRGVNAP